MRALGVARLAGVVHRARIVPVADVQHDANGWAIHLTEIRDAGERLARREFTAILGDGPDIYAGTHRIIDDGREGVLVQIEVEFTPLPECRFGSLQLFHFLPRRFKRRQ